MVRPKASGSKKTKRGGGVDFKKFKRKIGRKLPPPKNATNTQIKSKAIVLPEQSMLSERTGMAVNSRGLTLKELLQQTSHYNAKTRKVALNGIRDLLTRHPSELKLHAVAVTEKLRERICDSDDAVRAMLYNFLKTIFFPQIKEEISAPVISLLMAYVFNAMTHLAIDIRVMGFKFFLLIVQNHPSSFLLYAEKVLDCYYDILRNKQLYIEDKSKIKDVLDGLLHCLSSFAFGKEKNDSGNERNEQRKPLHAFKVESLFEEAGLCLIQDKFETLLTLLVHCFEEFNATAHAEGMIDSLSFSCMLYILRIISLVVKISFPRNVELPQRIGFAIHSITEDHNNASFNEPVYLKKLWELFPISSSNQSVEEGGNRHSILNIMISQIFFHFTELTEVHTYLKEKFLEFLETTLFLQVSKDNGSGVVILEKHVISLIEVIPHLVMQTMGYWQARLLQIFTSVFESCRVDSKLMSACIFAIMQMLPPRQIQDMQLSYSNSAEMLCYQVTWLRRLPEILLQLGDKHPSLSKCIPLGVFRYVWFSQIILEIFLCVGQSSMRGSSTALEYDNLQFSLREYFSKTDDQGVRQYGSFIKLPKDCQDIAVSGLFYFSIISLPLLQSLAVCFSCNGMEPSVRMRILEVLNSAYKSGRVKLADYIGFLITIIAHFNVYPEMYPQSGENDRKVSNRSTFWGISEAVMTCFSEMGDRSLVLRLSWKTLLEAMSLKSGLDNRRSMLRMIILLDSTSSRFTEESSVALGQIISTYLVDASSYLPGRLNEEPLAYRFYISPCIVLFLRSNKLLFEVLRFFNLGDCDSDSSKLESVGSSLLFMLNISKLHPNLSGCEGPISNIIHSLSVILSEAGNNMDSEKRCRLENLFFQIKAGVAKLLMQGPIEQG
ncbi:ARM repeat superfamily protein isoform X2 [Wolffia australiana]